MEELLDLLDETGGENGTVIRLPAETSTAFRRARGTESPVGAVPPTESGETMTMAGQRPEEGWDYGTGSGENTAAVGDLADALLDHVSETIDREGQTSHGERDSVRSAREEEEEPGGDRNAVRDSQAQTGAVRLGAGTMAQQLSGRLTQSRLRVLERENSRVTVSLREAASTGPELQVRDLDRAFRRDARRYDGGLTLL